MNWVNLCSDDHSVLYLLSPKVPTHMRIKESKEADKQAKEKEIDMSWMTTKNIFTCLSGGLVTPSGKESGKLTIANYTT